MGKETRIHHTFSVRIYVDKCESEREEGGVSGTLFEEINFSAWVAGIGIVLWYQDCNVSTKKKITTCI